MVHLEDEDELVFSDETSQLLNFELLESHQQLSADKLPHSHLFNRATRPVKGSAGMSRPLNHVKLVAAAEHYSRVGALSLYDLQVVELEPGGSPPSGWLSFIVKIIFFKL